MLEVLFFLLGTIIGSFLNVCIYRIPRKMSLLRPGSSCPHCKQRIPFYFNIPIVSYILLRGKCSSCGEHISKLYLYIELITGLLTVFLFWKYGLTTELPFYIIFTYFLIVIAVIDFNTQLIHNKVLLVMAAAGLLLNFILQVIPWYDAGLGILTGGITMFVFAWAGKMLFKKEAMGMGDVKFSAAAGIFLGWKVILIALYMGFVLALLTVLLLHLFKRVNLRERIPLGPFLASGLMLFILFGDHVLKLYMHLIL